MGQEQSNEEAKKPSGSKKTKAKIGDIIVVSKKLEASSEKKVIDEDLKKLKSIKFSKPVLNSSSLNSIDNSKMPIIIPGPLTEVVLRYQLHLTECADAVAFDQNSISRLIKEVENRIQAVYKSTLERQKSSEKAIEQIESVSEISKMLGKIEKNMVNCKMQLQILNRLLPVEDQIIDVELF